MPGIRSVCDSAVKNIGVDDCTRTSRKCDFAGRCGIYKLTPLYIENLYRLMPMPGILLNSMILELYTCADMGKVQIEIWQQFFFRPRFEFYTTNLEHQLHSLSARISSDLFTVEKMMNVPTRAMRIPAIRISVTPNGSSCPPVKFPAEQPRA